MHFLKFTSIIKNMSILSTRFNRRHSTMKVFSLNIMMAVTIDAFLGPRISFSNPSLSFRRNPSDMRSVRSMNVIDVSTTEDNVVDLSEMSWEEIEALEGQLISAQIGQGPNDVASAVSRSPGSAPLPLSGSTAFYRWAQDDEWVSLEVPLPRPALKRDVSLAVLPNSIQLSVRNAKQDIGLVSGELYGTVDPTSVTFEVRPAANPPPSSLSHVSEFRTNGVGFCSDPVVCVRVRKTAATEGTLDYWYGFLQQERRAPTTRFSWSHFPRLPVSDTPTTTSFQCRAPYQWAQRRDVVTLCLDVPPDTKAENVHIDFSPEGKSWKCFVDTLPLFGSEPGHTETTTIAPLSILQGEFWGVIRPSESTWFLQDSEDAQGVTGISGGEALGVANPNRAGWRRLEVELVKREPGLDEDGSTGDEEWWPWLHAGEVQN